MKYMEIRFGYVMDKVIDSLNCADFKGTSIKSYVWQVAEIFDTEKAMREDRELLSERVLTEAQINRVFADIPGDAD